MQRIKKISIPFRTSIIVTFVAIVGFCASCWLINSDLSLIPFGFLIAGGIIGLVYALSGLFLIIDEKKSSSGFSIASIAIRNFILIGAMIAMALIDKFNNIPFYNLYVFVGVYTVGIATYIIFNLIESKKEKNV